MSKIPAAIGPYSVYREVGNLVFVSGQLPVDGETGEFPSTTFEGQATQVMKNIQLVLEEVGATFSQIVKTTCFMKDLSDFVTFNQIYGDFFEEEFPARSAIQVAGLPKGALIEIEFIVAKN